MKPIMANNAGRAVRVVAPANDGMVHVFDAGPMPNPPAPMTSAGGTEVFAYIPKALFKGRCRGPAGRSHRHPGARLPGRRRADLPASHVRRFLAARQPTSLPAPTRADWQHDRRGRSRQGRQQLLRARPDRSGMPRTKPRRPARSCGNGAIPEVKYSYGRPVIVKVRDSTGPVVCNPGPPVVKCRWVVHRDSWLRQRVPALARSTSSML